LDRLDNLIKEVEINKESGYEKVLENLNQKRNHDFYAIRGQYKKTIITMPTCVFEDRMTIYRGGREISLLSLGFGDTQGDVFVHLPKEKILITGDAVVNPVPYGFSSEPLEWIQTLKKASDLDADVIVPGHGKVQYNKQYLIKLIESLEAIQVKVKEAIDNGVKSEEIIDKIDLRNIETEFTQQDPVLQFYFRLYFSKPLVTTLYDKLKSSALKQ
ncbi:MAG TPA: MBL fold metallo-hydrolase, partial [Chitinophagaceae bacterium]|nr:MBL fold metallo-hydrolase [Chitinophagaceae bacterium]